jgi:formate-dependent phosphoribosylglycinamide formyltransferase (GAR transformylase)
LTDTEVHVEHEHSESESIAEEVREGVTNALEEAREDAERVESIREVESEIAEVQAQTENHAHSEYASVGHTHPENEYSERIAMLESRIENLEHGLAEEVEEPVVEEIEPTEEHHEPPEKKRRHRFGRR